MAVIVRKTKQERGQRRSEVEKQRFLKELQARTDTGCRFCLMGLRSFPQYPDASSLTPFLEHELQALFGDVFVSVDVPPHHVGGEGNFGFLNFTSAAEAKIALTACGHVNADREDCRDIWFQDVKLSVVPASPLRAGVLGSKRQTTGTRRNASRFFREQMEVLLAGIFNEPCIGGVADMDACTVLDQDLRVAYHKGVPPSFGDETARARYALERCQSRVGVVYETLLSRDTSVASLRAELFDAGRADIHVISIGGGPGFDAAGVALAAANLRATTRIRCTVFDFETGWKSIVDAMGRQLAGLMQSSDVAIDISFEYADISLPLSHPSNQRLAAALTDVQLLIFSYVVHENESLLRIPGADIASGVGGIFPELFAQLTAAREEGIRPASPARLLFFDATPRLWPAMVATASRYKYTGHIPDVLRGRTRRREPLLLVAATGNQSNDGCEVDDRESIRVSEVLARCQSYLQAADRKRERLMNDEPEIAVQSTAESSTFEEAADF